MEKYKLTNGTATVYEGKDEIESVIKRFVKSKDRLINILNQYCLTDGHNSDLCILFKCDKTGDCLTLFRTHLGNITDMYYTLRYGYDVVLYPIEKSIPIFKNLINEFFEKNEDFILPYQKQVLNRIKGFDKIFIPLLTKKNDLIDEKILKKYFWFVGSSLELCIQLDNGWYPLYYSKVSKKHFISVKGRDSQVQVFFDKTQATDYTIGILTNRLESKKRQIEDLEKRINNLKSID